MSHHIPKTIHYCWFGRGEKPKLAQKCIASWHKYMPDYEIIEWNEDNFDVNYNAYTKMCYEQKKYAFLTDYLRLLIIEEHGGIYFDTDVEVLRNFDELLTSPAFAGFENDNTVATGLGFGAEPHNPVIRQMIREYEELLDGEHGVVVCPRLNTQALRYFDFVPNGQYQQLTEITIYPNEYFNPLDNNTGKLEKTKNTFSIHWYSLSWMDPKKKAIRKITRVFHRIFGENCFAWLKR